MARNSPAGPPTCILGVQGGNQFQSYGPQIASYADMLGSIWEAHIKLRVVSTCDVSLSRSWRGNSLNVCMARLTTLTQLLCGSTSMSSQSLLVRAFLVCLVHCLSITFNFILYPLLSKNSNCVLYAAKTVLLSNPDIGRPRITLDS